MLFSHLLARNLLSNNVKKLNTTHKEVKIAILGLGNYAEDWIAPAVLNLNTLN